MSHLEAIPLGGLGEFGMNLMVYRHGQDCLVVDAGMMFPRENHLGVDVVLPDLSFLDDCGTLHGLVLSHGHEDHIGAVPFLLARHAIPAYGSPYTLELLRMRFREHRGVDGTMLRPLPADGERVRVGPFELETVHVTHSIPQSKMVVLRTPVGVLVHTADFKLDPAPPGEPPTNLQRLQEIGDEGVLALFSDSTNADCPGFTEGEALAASGIEEQVSGHPGRVVLTTFASNVQRMQQVAWIAKRRSRKLAIVGQSMLNHAEVAQRLGLLRFPAGVRVSSEYASDLPPGDLMILATGSQGEPLSALARIAVGQHREITLEPGDRVIHSARVIPGNENSIGRMINHLLRRGAQVVTSADAPIHVSGHPAQDELRLLIRTLRPTYLVPIHGEYRQLHAHAALGAECGLGDEQILLAESGDVIAVGAAGVEIVDRVHVGQVFLDATLGELDDSMLQDRRRLAGEGVVVLVVAVDRESGIVSGFPEIACRGFSPDLQNEADLLQEAGRRVVRSVEEANPEVRADEAMLKARLQSDMRRFFRRRTRRRPLIVPVVVEL